MIKSRRSFLTTAAAVVATPVVSSLLGSTARAVSTDKSGPQLYPAALTMLDKQRRFDDAMNRDYLQFLDEGGADGVLVTGTTGEFSAFSVAERKTILESSVRHAGNLTILSHVGTSNLPETLELLKHAADAGAKGVLVVPPFYVKKPPLDGLIAYFEPILEASRLPVLVYNIPQLSGVPITLELIGHLSKFEKMAGMKDSYNKTEEHLEFIKQYPKLKFLTGSTRVLSSSLPVGGAGSITGSGSILLKETRGVFDAFKNGGDLEAAQEKLNLAGRAIRGLYGMPAMKYILSLSGLPLSYSRPPLVELTDEQKKKASETWAKFVATRG